MPLTVHYPSPASADIRESLAAAVPEAVFGEAVDAEVLIDGRPTPELVAEMPRLRSIVIPFAGVPEATLALAREHPNITLHNLHHNAPETAELAVALLMAAAKVIIPQDRLMRSNDWTPRYQPSRSVLLDGKTALILGYGEIGRRVAASCAALGMRVLAIRASATSVAADGPALVHPAAHMHELLPQTDVLVIAVPQTAETIGLLRRGELALLPARAILVNIARARIVDEEALFDALKSGRLHSAGLDVWYQYPKEAAGPGGQSVPGYFNVPSTATNTPPSAFPFNELDNVVMSPHRGGVSMGTEVRRVEHLARLLRAAADGGDMPNRVNVEAGY